jgi:hypothetical protein
MKNKKKAQISYILKVFCSDKITTNNKKLTFLKKTL